MRMNPFSIVVFIVIIAVVAYALMHESGAFRPPPVGVEDIQQGPIRHSQLPDAQVERIRKMEPIFAEVYPRSHEEWLDGFQRDLDPEPEIVIWEAMAAAYQGYTGKRSLSKDAKLEVFGLLLVRSAGDEPSTLAGAKLKHLSRAEAEEVLHLYSAAPQPVQFYRSNGPQ